MWIALNSSDFWNFCKEQKVYLEEQVKLSEYPDSKSSEILLELDERYSKLSKEFNGPIFLSHIKKVIPLTQEAKDSINQLMATFPNLGNYMRIWDGKEVIKKE